MIRYSRIAAVAAALLLVLLAGCAEESLLPAPGTTEGKKVQVEFAVPLPPETRGAMAFNPILDGPMYIAVFDKNQVLREFVPASYVGTVPNTNGTTGQFRADLSMANGWRSLHFIANCPVTAPAVEAGSRSRGSIPHARGRRSSGVSRCAAFTCSRAIAGRPDRSATLARIRRTVTVFVR